MTTPPRRISDRVLAVNITGYLMPAYQNRQPVLCALDGTDDLFVLVFSTHDKLEATMATYALAYDRIQLVMDGPDFIASIDEENLRGGRPYELRIAVDPYKHENGRTRWTEIFGVDGGVV